MNEEMQFGGPVSAVLEEGLRDRVRQKGIVVWLDRDDHYSPFVERLLRARDERKLSYQVVAFRGSHLELMLALEGVADGVERGRLLIHLPGFTGEMVRETPLLELYSAGVNYPKALDTLIREAATSRISPREIDAFMNQPEITLEGADEWLAAELIADEGGLPFALKGMKPTALFDDLLGGGYVAGQLEDRESEGMVWDSLGAWTGLPHEWAESTHVPTGSTIEDLAFAAASWALCVEYVDDLERQPVHSLLLEASELPRQVIEACRDIATHLRGRYPDFYRRTADETEALLGYEVEAARAEDLGKIDTFRFEEEKVLGSALEAVGSGDWDLAAGWAARRLDEDSNATSFWLQQDPSRQSAWQLLEAASRLGRAIASAGARMPAAEDLAAALAIYTQTGFRVDQAHRLLEQRRSGLLHPQVPQFEILRSRLDQMRATWREWADAWAQDFSALCRAHGFLPPMSLQQRTIFDEVVQPMTREPGTTAYFLIDALRYEMGDELFQYLKGTPATSAYLKGRFAELPTVTEVGMNVLAPVVKNEKLTPAISDADGGRILGFSTGEFRVSDPESRRRAIHNRVGGSTCPLLTLDEVVSRDSSSLRRAIAQARLVLVHSREIDEAGEKGLGPIVFDPVMRKLRAAWRLLRDAGVRRFVFTSDHGFLLHDASVDYALPHGRKIDPKRRHVLSSIPADHDGEVRVSLAELRYEAVDGHLMFPESTAVFDTGKSTASFVHGGNSFQERIIPVVTVSHRSAAGGDNVRYGITASTLEGVAGMHCLEVQVDPMTNQSSLDFGGAKEVELALRVPETSEVRVELCQTRGRARISGGAIDATVGEPFEVFFRLLGRSDARVPVELYHPSAVDDVASYIPDDRFDVEATRDRAEATADATAPAPSSAAEWLESLPEGGVRQFFEHLAIHGTVTESDATSLLGSPRALRRFTLSFEEYARKAPFQIRIQTAAGVKRYSRQGGPE